mmetsp:Transcript_11712/g.15288  ORF Transcript_11712/g.15288 Transcript_11712/m.15288 type:complete len:357 (+) Transcript_11712:109-1179(+)
MSNRKEELRALMKIHKDQKQQKPKGNSSSSKYEGKSKKELLAILKAKQANAKKKKLQQDTTKPKLLIKTISTASSNLPPKALPPGFFDAPAPLEPPKAEVAPPLPKTVLPGFGDDEYSDSDNEAPAEDIPKPEPAQPPSGLPEGFFDNPAAPVVEAPAKEDADDQGPHANTAAALPENFFDDPVADAKAKGIDLKAKKKAEQAKEWEEFQKFAENVMTVEQKEEKVDEESALEFEEKGELEQMEYFTRYVELLKKADHLKDVKEKKLPPTGKNRNKLKINDDISMEDEGTANVSQADFSKDSPQQQTIAEDRDSNDLITVDAMSQMLQKRKRKRTNVTEDDGYKPLDPLDWRAKMI